MTIDTEAVKHDSEAIIQRYGGEICDWLPSPDSAAPRRNAQAVARRALVLHAMLQIAFKAPIPVIKRWIEDNGLAGDLAESEREVLASRYENLTAEVQTDLFWYLEALWAFAWAGGLIPDLPFDEPVRNTLASLLPNLQHNEDGTRFLARFTLREHEQLFRMLDLYYRLHWWTRHAFLRGLSTPGVSIDIIMERRKALEWTLDAASDWDDVTMDT